MTVPRATRAGNEVTVPLLLYSREHGALNRNYFYPKIWRPARGTSVEWPRLQRRRVFAGQTAPGLQNYDI